MTRTYLQFPVHETGVYKNEVAGNLEFWFFNPANGKKKQIGGCKICLPEHIKVEWENQTAHELRALVAGTIGSKMSKGPLILSSNVSTAKKVGNRVAGQNKPV